MKWFNWVMISAFAISLAVGFTVWPGDGNRARGAGPTSAKRQAQPLRFEMLSAAYVNSTGSPTEREKVDALLKDIAGESKRLSGQGLESGKVFHTTVYARLSDILTEATKHCGIALPAAIALDSTQDDVIRQAAWRIMIEYKDYRASNLSTLCLVFLSSTIDGEPMTAPRAWITPEVLRARLASRIAQLCGVSDLFNEKGDISLALLTSEPKSWLRSVLQRGIAAAKNDEDRAIIAGCLLAIDGSPHGRNVE